MARLLTKSAPPRERNTFNLPTGTDIEQELVSIFRDQHAAILAYLDEFKALAVLEFKWGLPIAWPTWDSLGLGVSNFIERLEDSIKSIWEKAGAGFLALLGLDPDGWDANDPKNIALIEQGLKDLATEVNGTTSDQLQQALDTVTKEVTDGKITVEQGDAELTKDVNEIFGNAEDWRAKMIANTEASRAYHEAIAAAAAEFGDVIGWQWKCADGACFAADSKLLKVEDGRTIEASIETLRPGDLVIGGSGQSCKVLGIAAKPYRGGMVHGPGFTATPDHRFLTDDGWRPIGEYAAQTGFWGLLDFIVGKAKHVPTTFQKISRLPFVFASNLRSAMPVDAIGEDDKVKILDNKVNDPPVVHRHLFHKGNAVRSEQVGHKDFDVSSLRFDPMVVDVGTVSRAEIGFSSLMRADPTRIFRESFPTGSTDTGDSLFPLRVCATKLELALGLVRANERTKLLVVSGAGEPRGAEDVSAQFAGSVRNDRNGWVGSRCGPVARHATVFRSTLDAASRYLERLAALMTFLDRRCRSVSESACITTEAGGIQAIWTGAIGFSTLFARCVWRSLFGHDATLVGAESSPAFSMARLNRKRRATLMTMQGYETHKHIVPRLVMNRKVHECLVYDIEVEKDHSFVLACGLIAHNCEICLEIEAECQFVPTGRPFAIIGENATYQTIDMPPAHPNCYCTAEPVMAGDEPPDWGDTLIQPTGKKGYEPERVLGIKAFPMPKRFPRPMTMKMIGKGRN